MTAMTLHLKNMVCDRCKLVTTTVLERVGLHPVRVELGEVELREESLSPAVKDRLVRELEAVGFELLDDKRSQTVARIKAAITRLIRERDNQLRENLSDYLQQELQQDWEELMEQISLGGIASIRGAEGKVLQLRPKAANSKALTAAVGAEGEPIRTLPRGFYLKAGFTAGLLQQQFQSV